MPLGVNHMAMPEGVKLDLGCGLAKTPGHIGIDILNDTRVDVIHDLNLGLPLDRFKWEGMVEAIRCHHLIEHLESIIPLMNDCYRAMKTEAIFEISTPYAGTSQWWQDPTHKRGYIPESFLYFAKDSPFQKEQDEYGISARFEIVKAEKGNPPDEWQLFVVLKK